MFGFCDVWGCFRPASHGSLWCTGHKCGECYAQHTEYSKYCKDCQAVNAKSIQPMTTAKTRHINKCSFSGCNADSPNSYTCEYHTKMSEPECNHLGCTVRTPNSYYCEYHMNTRIRKCETPDCTANAIDSYYCEYHTKEKLIELADKKSSTSL